MSRMFLGLGVGAVCIASNLPQIVGLSWYRKSLAFYKDDIEEPLNVGTRALIQKVLDKMNISAEKRKYLEFFKCFESNPLHRGGAHLRSGAIIGIPPMFAYNDPSDIPKDFLSVGAEQKYIDWDSETGQKLLESMVLSDNAKAFAIGREVNYSMTSHIYVDLTLKMMFIGFGSVIIIYMNDMLQLPQRMRRGARYGIYSLVAATFGILYLIMSDTYNCWRDGRVDYKTASVCPEWAAGGLEFYEKSLQRNQALRQLLGSQGAQYYTPYGNDVATWRARHIQLTSRRDLMSKICKDINANSS